MPACTDARVDEQDAKNAAHSRSSGATEDSSVHTLIGRARPRCGRPRSASSAAARPQRREVGLGEALRGVLQFRVRRLTSAWASSPSADSGAAGWLGKSRVVVT